MSQRLLSQAGLTASKIASEVGRSGISPPSHPLSKSRGRRRLSSKHAGGVDANKGDETGRSTWTPPQPPIGQRAKQTEADREFFVDLLNSAATKRDAKAYLSRLQSPAKLRSTAKHRNSVVNLGNLFGRSRAVDTRPVFAQQTIQDKGYEEQEVQHVALVKISGVGDLSLPLLHGIAQTLSQLSRLSMAPCVVLEARRDDPGESHKSLLADAARLSALLDSASEKGARLIDCIFARSKTDKLSISLSRLLEAPLRRGQIPIVLPLAYSDSSQKLVSVSADDAILALVEELTGTHNDGDLEGERVDGHRQHATQQQSISVDRIIIIDQAGGIPNSASPDGKHVFLNLEQESAGVEESLRESGNAAATTHLSHLQLLKQALGVLPHSSSGLMTTPLEASNSSQTVHHDVGPTVGTRRQKNTLIHNLLTDRPAYSSSLPMTRLSRSLQAGCQPSVSTFVKRGMPIKMIPDPLTQPWTPEAPRLKLSDPCIDLGRLVHLVNDSFNHELDVDKYLKRVNDNIAGVIIAGDYEGGAILTWELPPGSDPQDSSRYVPYLDKFAVLKKSQGAGGVADIVFNAMVRTCFPHGVCWRSRKNNPVNKWYFERSSGTWKLPDMHWTMFWTTPGLTLDSRAFRDYEAVCRQIQPTWIDATTAAS